MKSKFITLFALFSLFTLSSCSITKPNIPHFDGGTEENNNNNDNNQDNGDDNNQDNDEDNNQDDTGEDEEDVSNLSIDDFLFKAANELENNADSFSSTTEHRVSSNGYRDTATLTSTYNKNTNEILYSNQLMNRSGLQTTHGYVKKIDDEKSIKMLSREEPNMDYKKSYKYVDSNYVYFFKNQIINLATDPYDNYYYSFPRNKYDLVRGVYFVPYSDEEIEKAINDEILLYSFKQLDYDVTKIELSYTDMEKKTKKAIFSFEGLKLVKYDNLTSYEISGDYNDYHIKFKYKEDHSLDFIKDNFKDDAIMVQTYSPKILVSSLNEDIDGSRFDICSINSFDDPFFKELPDGLSVTFYKDMFKKIVFDPLKDHFNPNEVKALYYDFDVIDNRYNYVLEVFNYQNQKIVRWKKLLSYENYSVTLPENLKDFNVIGVYGNNSESFETNDVVLTKDLTQLQIVLNLESGSDHVTDLNSFLMKNSNYFSEYKDYYLSADYSYWNNDAENIGNEFLKYKEVSKRYSNNFYKVLNSVSESNGEIVEKYTTVNPNEATVYSRTKLEDVYSYRKEAGDLSSCFSATRLNDLINYNFKNLFKVDLSAKDYNWFIRFDDSLKLDNITYTNIKRFGDSILSFRIDLSNISNLGGLNFRLERNKNTFNIQIEYMFDYITINNSYTIGFYNDNYDAIYFNSFADQIYN